MPFEENMENQPKGKRDYDRESKRKDDQKQNGAAFKPIESWLFAACLVLVHKTSGGIVALVGHGVILIWRVCSHKSKD